LRITRRAFLVIAGSAAATALAVKRLTTGARSLAPQLSGRTEEVTPESSFYITHFNAVPEIELKSWRLVVAGEVERELHLTLEDLHALPRTEDYNTLVCIGNGVGGRLIGNAKWSGVRLKDVLEMAGLRSGAKELALYGADGYMDSIPLERGLNPDTRLVYEMNDAALPREHGFPVRCIVPGLYGIKNVKWLERIEVLKEDVKGYWQRRGWSEEAEVKMLSRIDQPRNGEVIGSKVYEIRGIAFGGEHAIARVEVSTDGGATWSEAKLKPRLSEHAWTLWSYEWSAPSPGEHEIVVRAIDESGRAQSRGNLLSRRAFPDGAEGYHRVRVKVARDG